MAAGWVRDGVFERCRDLGALSNRGAGFGHRSFRDFNGVRSEIVEEGCDKWGMYVVGVMG